MGIIEEALEKIKKEDQPQVLAFWDDLDASQQEEFARQIINTDFEGLHRYTPEGKGHEGKISPIPVRTVEEIAAREAEWKEKGLTLLRQEKAAAVLLAGGMGTRLGSDGPKGVYDIGVTKPVYIFQRLIENLLDVVREAGVYPDLYIMTSEKNDAVTKSFLAEHDYFGYEASHVYFFEQENAPACDLNGKIYLEEKGRLATSPNGNGGWYRSLINSEAGKAFLNSKAEWLNVFAVDNVLQRILDPVFIGAVLEAEVNSGAKVIRKNAPDEGVGVLCLEDGYPTVIEYYELTDELMNTLDDKGQRLYDFGVILNYLFRRKTLDSVVNDALPFHRVKKKIPCLDQNGELYKPSEPNGYKFEMLVLDLVRSCETCLAYEVVREKEFAPIKNRTGKDSVESARELLKQNGIEI